MIFTVADLVRVVPSRAMGLEPVGRRGFYTALMRDRLKLSGIPMRRSRPNLHIGGKGYDASNSKIDG